MVLLLVQTVARPRAGQDSGSRVPDPVHTIRGRQAMTIAQKKQTVQKIPIVGGPKEHDPEYAAARQH